MLFKTDSFVNSCLFWLVALLLTVLKNKKIITGLLVMLASVV